MTAEGESSVLLFFDTFAHDHLGGEDINLDLVQFPTPVIVDEVRVIPLGAKIEGNVPGRVRLGATNPNSFDVEFFVNDLSRPGISTFESLGVMNYGSGNTVKAIQFQTKVEIPTDGLVLKGPYQVITLAILGRIARIEPEPEPVVAETTVSSPVHQDDGKSEGPTDLLSPPMSGKSRSPCESKLRSPSPSIRDPRRLPKSPHSITKEKRRRSLGEDADSRAEEEIREIRLLRKEKSDRHKARMRSRSPLSVLSPPPTSSRRRRRRGGEGAGDSDQENRTEKRNRRRSSPSPRSSKRSRHSRSRTKTPPPASPPYGPEPPPHMAVGVSSTTIRSPSAENDAAAPGGGALPPLVEDVEAISDEEMEVGSGRRRSGRKKSGGGDLEELSDEDLDAQALANIWSSVEESDGILKFPDPKDLDTFQFGSDIFPDLFCPFDPDQSKTSIPILKNFPDPRLRPEQNFVRMYPDRNADLEEGDVQGKVVSLRETLEADPLPPAKGLEFMETLISLISNQKVIAVCAQDGILTELTPLVIRWVDFGISLEVASSQPKAPNRIRHLKVGLKLVNAVILECHEWAQALINGPSPSVPKHQTLFESLMTLYLGETCSLPLKLLVLEVVDASLSILDAAQKFTSPSQSSFYEVLVRDLTTQDETTGSIKKVSVRIKDAISRLMRKLSLCDTLSGLKKVVADLATVSLECVSSTSADRGGESLLSPPLGHDMMDPFSSPTFGGNLDDMGTSGGGNEVYSCSLLKPPSSDVSSKLVLFLEEVYRSFNQMEHLLVPPPRYLPARVQLIIPRSPVPKSVSLNLFFRLLTLKDFMQCLAVIMSSVPPDSNLSPIISQILSGFASTPEGLLFLACHRQETAIVLRVTKDDAPASLRVLESWLSPITGRSARNESICDTLETLVSQGFTDGIPGKLVMTLRVLQSIALPPRVSCQLYPPPCKELRYLDRLNSLCEADLQRRLLSLINALVTYYGQPSAVTPLLTTHQGYLSVFCLQSAVSLLREIMQNTMTARDSDDFRDFTPIQPLVLSWVFLQAVPSFSPQLALVQLIKADIVEILLLYTRSPTSKRSAASDENGSTTGQHHHQGSSLQKSLWTSMLREVIETVSGAPHLGLPGIQLLAELLPLPLPILVPSGSLLPFSLPTVLRQRALWSTHLTALSAPLCSFLAYLLPSTSTSLIYALKRFLGQLADLGPSTALIVARVTLSSMSVPSRPASMNKEEVAMLISTTAFCSKILGCDTVKSAVLQVLRGGNKMDIVHQEKLKAITLLLQSESVTSDRLRQVILGFIEALCDWEVGLSKENSLPRKQDLRVLLESVVKYVKVGDPKLQSMQVALELLTTLSRSKDPVKETLQAALNCCPSTFVMLLDKLSSDLHQEKQNADFIKTLSTLAETIQALLSLSPLSSKQRWIQTLSSKGLKEDGPLDQICQCLEEAQSLGEESFDLVLSDLKSLIDSLSDASVPQLQDASSNAENLESSSSMDELKTSPDLDEEDDDDGTLVPTLQELFEGREAILESPAPEAASADPRLSNAYWLMAVNHDESVENEEQIECELSAVAKDLFNPTFEFKTELPYFVFRAERERKKRKSSEAEKQRNPSGRNLISSPHPRRGIPLRSRGVFRTAVADLEIEFVAMDDAFLNEDEEELFQEIWEGPACSLQESAGVEGFCGPVKEPRSGPSNEGVKQQQPKVPLMELNVHKAGMNGLDKARINALIEEVSKGSKFYLHKQKMQAKIDARVRSMLLEKQRFTPGQIQDAQKKCALLIRSMEDSRDLSRTIVHIDMDAFYAAVEMRDNPSLKLVKILMFPKFFSTKLPLLEGHSALILVIRDKPMAVGGMGMLSTSNYLARQFGVRAAMPGFIGKKLCPNLIIVPPNFEKYKEVSDQVCSIFEEYDSNFCAMSLDEAYLDLTDYIYERTTQSDEEVTPESVVEEIPTREAIMDFVKDLPVRKISGIGNVTEQLLAGLGVKTCHDLYENRALLSLLFSSVSLDFFLRISLGMGCTDIRAMGEGERKSVSCERTFRDTSDPGELMDKARKLSEELSDDLKKRNLLGKSVTLKIKTADFAIRTRVRSLTEPTNDATVIRVAAQRTLAVEMGNARSGEKLCLRLMGVRMSDLCRDGKSEEGAGDGSSEAFLPGRRKKRRSVAVSAHLPSKSVKDLLQNSISTKPKEVQCPACLATVEGGLQALNQHLDSGCLTISSSSEKVGCICSPIQENVTFNKLCDSSIDSSCSTPPLCEISDGVRCPVCDVALDSTRSFEELSSHVDLCLNGSSGAADRKRKHRSEDNADVCQNLVAQKRQRKSTIDSFFVKKSKS
ncbi:unnamed protein product [Cyprideis torosa]|uniref:DNA polymerase kappa n=1 Tax=Cyprideis torosa TaxID=163714 RepID=A0A7R8ZFG2_9CRUS|nr:unnamed protein product [Cyprideis torosa]CAG0879023.1 unnamed protein product [Cyprideis torosa]